MTDLVYLRDAQLTSLESVVTAVDDSRVELDATVFYVLGGGQPADVGTLSWIDGEAAVTDVRKKEGTVWHHLDGPIPAVGTTVTGTIDGERRQQLMRTHSAMHVLGGVVYNRYGVTSTGNNMEPLKARIDFDFGTLPEGFAEDVTAAVNAEIAADRPIEVSFLPRNTAVEDADLLRTKVNLIPESVKEIRVVDIVGLDKQADGGTHVDSTGEIGHFEITKTESKGGGNKRVRFVLS
ncbi:MAG: alanyl-tRNA editing protein [Acidimicrobiales bacterium]|nr:alanyl-tRNA editing protein [Acidimicrobiales bacterium]